MVPSFLIFVTEENRTGKGSENGSFPLEESIENRGFLKGAFDA